MEVAYRSDNEIIDCEPLKVIINTRFAFVHFIYRTYVLGDGRGGAYSSLGAQNYFLGGFGWALIRGWALINFSYLKGGGLFEVGAYSRLGGTCPIL